MSMDRKQLADLYLTLSPKSLTLGGVLFAALIGASIFFLLQGWSSRQSFYLIIGAVSSLYFTFLLVLFFSRVLQHGFKRIKISVIGVEDLSWGIGAIEWQDIVSVELLRFHKESFISVQVVDPQKYLSRLSKSQKRLLKLNALLGVEGLFINAGNLKISPEEVLRILKDRITRTRASL